MISHQKAPEWMVRYLRIGAALMVGLALLTWVTPVNVSSTDLIPFGCGSPAAPSSGELARFVCTNELANMKALVLVLLIVAGVLLLMSEVATTRWGLDRWFLGVTVVAPVALPLLMWSVVSMFLVVGAVAADGTLIRCGTAVAQASDPISMGLCGQLADRKLSLSLGGVVVTAGVLAGAAYVGAGGNTIVDGAPETAHPGAQDPGAHG